LKVKNHRERKRKGVVGVIAECAPLESNNLNTHPLPLPPLLLLLLLSLFFR
jgi:hypothetical protein